MTRSKIASSKIPSGRLPYQHDYRTLNFRDIVNQQDKKKKIPAQYDWGRRIKPNHNWGDYGNLKLDNCTFATAAHAIIIWKSYKADKIYRPGVKNIIDDYSKLIIDKRSKTSVQTLLNKGGKPLAAIKVLNYWRKKGIDGHKNNCLCKTDF